MKLVKFTLVSSSNINSGRTMQLHLEKDKQHFVKERKKQTLQPFTQQGFWKIHYNCPSFKKVGLMGKTPSMFF